MFTCKTEFTLAPLHEFIYTPPLASSSLYQRGKGVELSRPRGTSLKEKIQDLIATFDLLLHSSKPQDWEIILSWLGYKC